MIRSLKIAVNGFNYHRVWSFLHILFAILFLCTMTALSQSPPILKADTKLINEPLKELTPSSKISYGGNEGFAVVAVRSNAVAGLGHIGVAFENADGTFTAGAVEGNDHSGSIKPGDENGGWCDNFQTLDEVEGKFLELGYDKIKIIPISNSDPIKASAAIGLSPLRGYNALTNNCLFVVDEALEGYGLKSKPFVTLMPPNVYFSLLPGNKYIRNSQGDSYSPSNSDDSSDLMGTNDLGGVNFTSINMNYISVKPDAKDKTDFDFILKAQKAKGEGHGIDAKNSTLMGSTAFMTGLTLSNEKFWVNLNPWEPSRIVDEQLGRSEVGRILLEADLQMKRDFSNYGNPCANQTGKELWTLLDKKREALVQQCMNRFPGEIENVNNVLFMPVTRHWIVPDKIYAYTNGTQIYVINATLTINSEPVADYSSFQVNNREIGTLSKGCLEELNKSAKEYGQYNKELDDRMILPYVVWDLNRGEKYGDLRDVYIALALAQWYKSKITADMDIFRDGLDPSNTMLKAQPWSPNEIWDKYVYSFKNGEYKCWENTTAKTTDGFSIKSRLRSAGGVDFSNIINHLFEIKGIPLEIQDLIKRAITEGFITQEKDILFGNRLHVDNRQEIPVSSSGSGSSPRPPEINESKQEVHGHGHSSENKTDILAYYSNENTSGQKEGVPPTEAKIDKNSTRCDACPEGWNGPSENCTCWRCASECPSGWEGPNEKCECWRWEEVGHN